MKIKCDSDFLKKVNSILKKEKKIVILKEIIVFIKKNYNSNNK